MLSYMYITFWGCP